MKRQAAMALLLVVPLHCENLVWATTRGVSQFEQQVIPEDARYGSLFSSIRPEGIPSETTASTSSTSCIDSAFFASTYPWYAPYCDSVTSVTHFYVGNAYTGQIIDHLVDLQLNHTESPLATAFGVPLFAEDLDADGALELVVQRGDPGFGGDGYLDIMSAPDWSLRDRFVLPGRKVEMRPFVIDLDGNGSKELIANPNDFTSATILVIEYNSQSGHFEIRSALDTPDGAYGKPAYGDFDLDGKIEIFWGGITAFSLFEAQGANLSFVGAMDPGPVNSWAISCTPKPDGTLCALLGHSNVDDYGWLYRLYVPNGDNSFVLDTTFRDCLGWSGIPRAAAADVDCDGLDEIIMKFGCFGSEIWSWDVTLGAYTQGCRLDASEFGSMHDLAAADVTRDGKFEWVGVKGLVSSYEIHFIFDETCENCDQCGRCRTADTSCGCPCHNDADCNGQIDVMDVVATVGVAFRGDASVSDSCHACDYVQRIDVNCDGMVNVTDVVKMVGVAFRGQSAIEEFCHPCTRVVLAPPTR